MNYDKLARLLGFSSKDDLMNKNKNAKLCDGKVSLPFCISLPAKFQLPERKVERLSYNREREVTFFHFELEDEGVIIAQREFEWDPTDRVGFPFPTCTITLFRSLLEGDWTEKWGVWNGEGWVECDPPVFSTRHWLEPWNKGQ